MAQMYAPPSIDIKKSPDLTESIGDSNILIGHRTGGRFMRNKNILIGDGIQVEGNLHFSILLNNEIFTTVMTDAEHVVMESVMLRALNKNG